MRTQSLRLPWAFLLAGSFTWAQVPAPPWDPGGLVFDDGSLRGTFPVALRGLHWAGWTTDDGMGTLTLAKGMEDIGRPMKPQFRWHADAPSLHRDLTLDSPLGPCLGEVHWVPSVLHGAVAFDLPVSFWAHYEFIWNGPIGERTDRDMAALLKSARRVEPGEPIRSGELVYAGLGYRLPGSIPAPAGPVSFEGWTAGRRSAGGLDGHGRAMGTGWGPGAGLAPAGTPPEPVPDPGKAWDVLISGVPARESTAAYLWTNGGAPVVTRTWYVASKPGERGFSVWFGVTGNPGEPRADVEAEAERAWQALLKSLVLR